MSRTPKVYPDPRHSITLIFDVEAPNSGEVFGVFKTFKASFGEGYCEAEALYPPHHFCLHLYPGAALRVAA